MATVTGLGPVIPAQDAALIPGQRIAARVLEMLESGDVVLEVGQDRAVVAASNPLNVGDRVVLEVVTAGIDAKFSIVTNSVAATPQTGAGQPDSSGFPGLTGRLSPHDLPVILRALADAVPGAAPMAAALETFLRAATTLELRPAVLDQIQRLSGPLNAALPPETLAATIRASLAQSGLFTENHLRATLNGSPLTSTADQRQAGPDLRLLLGQLTAAGAPVPEAVRSLGDALLQEQLVVAERLAGTGVGQVTIPFTFGGQRADVMFEWEREARRGTPDQPDHAVSLGVFVHLPALGTIETRVDWKPHSLAVTFYVEREATRAIVEAGLAGFSEQLSQAGCPAVTSSVWLNPDRVASVGPVVKAPVPAGTILNVIA